MAKRPAYATKKSPVTGTVEMGERVATTPRRKTAKGYVESGMSDRSPMNAKNVGKRMKKAKMKANADPRMPAYSAAENGGD